jgi:hypothetical protein
MRSRLEVDGMHAMATKSPQARFLLMILYDEEAWACSTHTEREHALRCHEALKRDLAAQHKLVSCEQLGPSSQARTLRALPNGGRIDRDGPFWGTLDVMGGYYVIESESTEEAVGWARRLSTAGAASIEVRPLADAPRPETDPNEAKRRLS